MTAEQLYHQAYLATHDFTFTFTRCMSINVTSDWVSSTGYMGCYLLIKRHSHLVANRVASTNYTQIELSIQWIYVDDLNHLQLHFGVWVLFHVDSFTIWMYMWSPSSWIRFHNNHDCFLNFEVSVWKLWCWDLHNQFIVLNILWKASVSLWCLCSVFWDSLALLVTLLETEIH